MNRGGINKPLLIIANLAILGYNSVLWAFPLLKLTLLSDYLLSNLLLSDLLSYLLSYLEDVLFLLLVDFSSWANVYYLFLIN